MEESLKTKTNRLRREHILAAALGVFAERGYRGATIRDIANAAGVSDGTIYNAFSNKAELLLSLIEPLADRMPERADSSLTMENTDALARMLGARFAALAPNVLEMLRVVLSEALVDAEIRKLFFDRVISPALLPLREAIAQSSQTNGWGAADPDIASRMIVASVLGFAVLRMLGDPLLADSWSRVPEQLSRLFALDPHLESEA